MTWRCGAPSTTPHSAAAKKPFRPPLTRPAAPATDASPPRAAAGTTSREPAKLVQLSQRQRRRQEDEAGSGTDPDSSFDLSFDFDPEALEAAMRKYD
jgi:hypothetical protein